ncbi:MAG: serine--tRNA ligase [Flavobacteriales bacterium]|nr:MAG: serine--tRNA ligase [Flavobacteriales bacterium]
MLQLNVIRDTKDEVIRRLAKKNFKVEIIEEIISIDAQRRKTQAELDELKAEGNIISRQVGELMKAGKKEEANELKNKSVALKEKEKTLQDVLNKIEDETLQLLYVIPNVPNDQVPNGKTPDDNKEVYSHGVLPQLSAEAKPHWDLAAQYDLIDFELGNKITGAGFPVYKGKMAKLQRSLINYFLDTAIAAGYLEVQPPILINKDSGFGTGQLPDKEGQMYHVGVDDLYLVPTAEVPITNMYRDVILTAEDFPIKNCGYTPCFRREAGSYGKDVRGLNRLHQFDKVEIVQLAHPSNSYAVLEEMRSYVQDLLKALELPFRTLLLCGGDMSFASAMTYDMEVYSGAQKKWLEVSSVSNFESFQANRLKLRFKQGTEKPQLAHTLNGSALALPRICAAILENNQTPNGILVPQVLRAYTGFDIIN